MNIIFLDVDGVLNSERSCIAGSSRMNDYHLANPDDPYYKMITKCTIDPIACELMNKLAREFNAGFVISSTHRKHFPDNPITKLFQLQEYFQFLGIEGSRITGWTPSLWNHGETLEEREDWHATQRGREIDDWIDMDGSVTNYVIIDDSSDMLQSQKGNFVRVDPNVGFSAQNYRDASRILGREYNG